MPCQGISVFVQSTVRRDGPQPLGRDALYQRSSQLQNAFQQAIAVQRHRSGDSRVVPVSSTRCQTQPKVMVGDRQEWLRQDAFYQDVAVLFEAVRQFGDVFVLQYIEKDWRLWQTGGRLNVLHQLLSGDGHRTFSAKEYPR